MANFRNRAASPSDRVTRSAKRRKLNTYGRSASRVLSSPLETLKNAGPRAFGHIFNDDMPSTDIDQDINEGENHIVHQAPEANMQNSLRSSLSVAELDRAQHQSCTEEHDSQEPPKNGLGQECKARLPASNENMSDVHTTTNMPSELPPPTILSRTLEVTAGDKEQLGQRGLGRGQKRIKDGVNPNHDHGSPADYQAVQDTPTKRKPGRPRKYLRKEAEMIVGNCDLTSEQQRHKSRMSILEDISTGSLGAEPKSGSSPVRKIAHRQLPNPEASTTPLRRSGRSQGQDKSRKRSYSNSTAHTEPSDNPAVECKTGQGQPEPRSLPGDSPSPFVAKLKGILTPTNRKTRRQNKLVNFQYQDQKDIEHRMSSDDLPSRDKHLFAKALTGGSTNSDGMNSVTKDVDMSLINAEHDLQKTPQKPSSPYHFTPDAHMHDENSGPSAASAQAEESSNPDRRILASHLADLGKVQKSEALIAIVKSILLGKLTGRRPIRLIGLDEAREQVRLLIEQTVTAGEGNSMLLIGARGSGKSALVESLISDLAMDYRDDFYVIRLNGFMHTDDKLALREIWRQLGREMEVEEDGMNKTSNYADTLSSLLALLSHSSELAQRETNETAKSVIFILDEFDLFTSHPRQTLLYNLFEIAQSRKAPIAVLGLTSRVDVTESLEKRVKSRFSHRCVFISLPKSLSAFWYVCKEGLTISPDDLQPRFTSSTESVDEEGLLGSAEGSRFREAWNTMIENDLYHDPMFSNLLQSIYYRTKSAKDLFAAAMIPIATLQPSSLPLTGQSFVQNDLSPPESKLDILPGLSDLELALLIAAARLDIILDTDTCNFNMAYDEYTTLASRVKVQSSASGAAAVGAGSKIWGREVAMGAWEKLMDYQLVVPAIGSMGGGVGVSGTGGGAGSREVSRAEKMVKVDVGLEEILPSMPGMSAIMAKWCREI